MPHVSLHVCKHELMKGEVTGVTTNHLSSFKPGTVNTRFVWKFFYVLYINFHLAMYTV